MKIVPTSQDDPDAAKACAARPALPKRGTFTADPFYSVTGASDLSIAVDTGDLAFGFVWEPKFVDDPENGPTRLDQTGGMFLTFTDPKWQRGLVTGATFDVNVEAGAGFGYGCSAYGSWGAGGDAAYSSEDNGVLTITKASATELAGTIVMDPGDGSGPQHFTFDAPFNSPIHVPEPDETICCLE